MTHPLTDEICRKLADSMTHFPNGFPDAHDSMRAGADWQLEQCAEELECLLSIFVATGVIKLEVVPTAVELFKSNMRPQENN